MTTLLIATRNAHKVGEIQAILGPEFRCLTLKEFPDAPPVVEDAETFAGNATKKAVELAKWVADNLKQKAKNPKLDFWQNNMQFLQLGVFLAIFDTVHQYL